MPSLLTTKQNSSKEKKTRATALILLKQFFKENSEALGNSYPGLKLDFFIGEFEAFSGIKLETSPFDSIFKEKWNRFSEFLERGVPFEYITKRAFFFESFFYVDKRVLIPRFETEILLEYSLNELKRRSRLNPKEEISLCEVGIGPGTLGFSLLKAFKESPVSFLGIDISAEALEVAKINKFRLSPSFRPEHRVSLGRGDRLFGITEQFDLIVSNPPYIKKEADKELVHEMVLAHEPEVALFLEDELYDNWFQDFFKQAKECLKSSGEFLMEGHESHLEYLGSLCENVFGAPVEIINDLSGVPRLLKVRKNNG